MNSTCLFKLYRISTISHLRSISGSFLSIKPKQTLFVPSSSLLKPVSPIQNRFQMFWETFPSPVLSYFHKDGLDKEKYQLIYKTSLFNYAFYSQLVSMFGFAIQLSYSSYQAYKVLVLHEVADKLQAVGPFEIHYDIISLGILAIFTVQNFLLFYLAQRAVLRGYQRKDSDEYIFVTLSINPFKSQLNPCRPKELECLNIENAASILGNHKLKGKKLFLKFNDFKNMSHYNKLLR